MSKDHATELIDAMSEHRSMVFAADDKLRDLADAAYALGQDRLAKQLIGVAQSITTTADRLNGAVGGSINGRLIEAEQATANMISAALGGMRLAGSSEAMK